MKPNYFILPGLKSKPNVGPWFDKDIVINTICESKEVSRDKINGKLRYRHISYCRHLIFYFLRSNTGMTFLEIGTLFNKDHSTVLHGFNTILGLMKVDPNVKEEIDQLKTKILENHL